MLKRSPEMLFMALLPIAACGTSNGNEVDLVTNDAIEVVVDGLTCNGDNFAELDLEFSPDSITVPLLGTGNRLLKDVGVTFVPTGETSLVMNPDVGGTPDDRISSKVEEGGLTILEGDIEVANVSLSSISDRQFQVFLDC